MDSCTSESGEPASSGPFSVAEFGNLVALAFQLESQDRLSQTLVHFGQGLEGGDNPETNVKPQTRGVKSSPSHSTIPASLVSTYSSSSMDFVTAPSFCHTSSPSRPRQLLNKIKRHASVANHLRHEPKERYTNIIQSRLSTTSLGRRSPVSFFEDSDSDEDYVHPSPSPSITIQRPDTPKPTPSHTGFSIFSRPPSVISRPGTEYGRDSPDSSPPSPLSSRARSNSSSSTASTITDHACRTPTTPVFITSDGNDAHERKAPTIASNRWSLYAEDPSASQPPSPSEDSSLYSGYTFADHPFATPSLEEGDPFAKNAVQVVRSRSIGASNPKPKRNRRRRASPTLSLPPTPPPSCPLPPPPMPGFSGEEDASLSSDMPSTSASEVETSSVTSGASSSSSDEDEGFSECDGSCEGACEDENCDWTLGLGALPRDDAERLSALRKKKCRGNGGKRRRSGTVTLSSVREETDWTLSLPLKKVAFPGKAPKQGSPEDNVPEIVTPPASTPSSQPTYARSRKSSGAVRIAPSKLSIRPPPLSRSPSLQTSTLSPSASTADLRVPSLKASPTFPSASALATGTSAAFNLPPSFPSTPSGSEDEAGEAYASAFSSPSRYSRSSMSRYSLTSAFHSPPASTPPGFKSLPSLHNYPFPSPPTSLSISLGSLPPRPPRRSTPLLPIGPTPTSSLSSPRSPTSSMTSLPRTVRRSTSSVGSQLTIPRSLKTVKSERDVSRRESVYHTARESMSSQASSM